MKTLDYTHLIPFFFFFFSESAHVLYKQNWTIEALDPLRKFEASVLKEINLNHKLLVRTWTFSDSLFYSVTILTTIGKHKSGYSSRKGNVLELITSCVIFEN